MRTTTAESAATVPLPVPDLEDEHPIGEFDEGRRLIGTECRACGVTMLGARVVCSSCVSTEVQRIALAPEGILYSHTTLRVGPNAERTLGYVDIGAVRALSMIRVESAPLVIDGPVELRVDGDDWWFSPVTQQEVAR